MGRAGVRIGLAVLVLAGAVACGTSQDGGPPVDADQSAAAAAGAERRFEIALDTAAPMPMKSAPLDVVVREAGQPARDVDVSVELRMPPSGAMGEMRTGTELKPAGDGHYRGEVDLMMAGQWNAIVRVRRNGEVVATHTEPVTAQ